MRKMIRKLTAAILALTCLPLTGVTASAETLPNHFGEVTWDAFEDMELMGHGKYSTGTAELYLRETEQREGYLENDLVLVQPRETWMRFVLREDIDPDWGEEQTAEVLRSYFPDIVYGPDGISPTAEYWRESPRRIELHLMQTTRPENAEELETAILLDLAHRHLISEFYGWGETARYDTGFFGGLNNYPLTQQISTGTPGSYQTVAIDWDAVQDYLNENHPGCTTESNENMTSVMQITGTEEFSYREQIALACELWEQFDIVPPIMVEPNDAESVTGHNALETPGDTTLDCEVDILDVIALNKQLLGASTLCDTAAKNADIDRSGTPDETDSLALLKYVVGLSDALAES